MTKDESQEMYLETILLLSKSTNNLKAIDIVNHLKYSKPSVSVAMKNLKTKGFITIDNNHKIDLTNEGYLLATKVYERHVHLTKFFELIGVPTLVASCDACKIEHVISDTSLEYIKKFIESNK